MAYSLSGLTLFHPSCHPQPSSYTGLLKCAKRVPISGPLCQLFPLQGILFPLTSAWLAAFCLDLSLAITFQRSKENSCSTVVAQPLSRHLILPLWIMLTTTWDCALLVRLILCFPLPVWNYPKPTTKKEICNRNTSSLNKMWIISLQDGANMLPKLTNFCIQPQLIKLLYN